MGAVLLASRCADIAETSSKCVDKSTLDLATTAGLDSTRRGLDAILCANAGRVEGEPMEPLGVVLTAGLGTRLQPLTPATPKPLVPLLNRPLIAYALDLMRDLGLREVAVVVGPDDEATGTYARGHAPADFATTVAVQQEACWQGEAVAAVGAALKGRTVVVLAVDIILCAP